uniref:Secreted protein n=1 Tax=Globodera pallida TaxID=36090 RepID=A0A183CLB6_GLOPA
MVTLFLFLLAFTSFSCVVPTSPSDFQFSHRPAAALPRRATLLLPQNMLVRSAPVLQGITSDMEWQRKV